MLGCDFVLLVAFLKRCWMLFMTLVIASEVLCICKLTPLGSCLFSYSLLLIIHCNLTWAVHWVIKRRAKLSKQKKRCYWDKKWFSCLSFVYVKRLPEFRLLLLASWMSKQHDCHEPVWKVGNWRGEVLMWNIECKKEVFPGNMSAVGRCHWIWKGRIEPVISLIQDSLDVCPGVRSSRVTVIAVLFSLH